MTATRTRLRADLHRVPDVTLAQLKGNWPSRYQDRRLDKDAWILALLEAGERARVCHERLFDEPVRLRVEVYYPTASVPDLDNITAAIKPLIDLLEPLHRAGRGTRGYVGWVANDRLIASLSVERFTDAGRAPLTRLEMEAVG